MTGGVLTFKKSPDFEAAAANDPTNDLYDVTVTVTDSDSGTRMMLHRIVTCNRSTTWTKRGR